MQSFWHYARYLLRYKGRLTVALTCAVISAICFGGGISMALPILRVLFKEANARTFYDVLVELDANRFNDLIPDILIEAIPRTALGGLMVLVGALILLTVIGGITKFIHAYLSTTATLMAVEDIRTDVFQRIMYVPLLNILDEPVTDKVSRVMRDTTQLGRGFIALVTKSTAQTLRGLAALAVAFWANAPLTLVSILLAPVLIIVTAGFGKIVRRYSRRVLAEYSNLLGLTTQSLQGVRVVKVHTAEEVEVERLRYANRRLLRAEFKTRRWKVMGPPTIESTAMVGFGLIILFAGWQITQGGAGSSHVALTLISVGICLTSLKPLTYLWLDLSESGAASERLQEMASLEPETKGDADRPDLPSVSQSITFDDVSFSYHNAPRPALRGVSLEIPRGSTFAFVGPNGCGKTTLLGLVPRLYDPTEGVVRIDGRDLRDVSLKSLRDRVGVVTQETVLFYDTIANNIAYGSGEIPRERIEAAARQAYADDFIQTKPDGYDTMVSYQGTTLSGGERQRLAIARAILRDPDILILDEATSMIDAETESLITETLEEFCKSRTSLVIAHRLSTVVNADQIVVMDQGQILDIGRHDELMERCELYQQLCRTQLVSPDQRDDENRSDNEVERERQIDETVALGDEAYSARDAG